MADNKVMPRLCGANIKFHNYTLSLLDEAYRCGMISDDDAARFRLGLSDALSEAIELYTLGESTSVLSETAGALLASVLFSCDAYLMTLPTAEAVELMRTISVKGIYQRGMRQLRLLVCEATSLLVKVRRTRAPIPEATYNEVINTRALEYLRSYNIAVSAHVGGKFEYPLALPCSNLRGIHYIKGYLRSLLSENEFVAAFDPEQVQLLYIAFCRRNGFTYVGANINLYTLVFENALICEYLQKDGGSLMLTREDCDKVTKIFSSLTYDERTDVLMNAAARLCGGDNTYNRRAVQSLLPPLLSAIENAALQNHVTITTEEAETLAKQALKNSETAPSAVHEQLPQDDTDDDITQFPY